MKYYHATTKECIAKIVKDGTIKHSCGGVVFLCTDPIDACKFIAIRGEKEVYTIEVDLPEDSVKESNDHSETFFPVQSIHIFWGHKVDRKGKSSKIQI